MSLMALHSRFEQKILLIMKSKVYNCVIVGLLSLYFYSCANGQVKKDYWGNGNLKTETRYKDDLKNGEEKKYYSGGELKSIITYKNGKQEGPYFVYYENGSLQQKGTLLQGEPIGMYYEFTETGDSVFKRFCSKGHIQIDIRYENNRPFRIMDFKNKWMTIYNEDGTVKDSIPIKGWD